MMLGILSFPGCGGGSHPSTVSGALFREWDIHHNAERSGREEAALTGYRRMCRQKPPYVRACFDAARLLFELRPLTEARAATRATILRFPDDALTQSAIKRLRKSYRKDVEAGMREMRTLADATRGQECHDTVLFEIARLARSSTDRPGEIAALELLMKRFSRWESQLWDNAAWRLAALHRESGDIAAEKRVLKALLDTRERSRLIGSYTSPYHDDALLRLGEIQLAEGKRGLALEIFLELGRQETSQLREEGLLRAARIERSRGDTRAACRLLTEILGRDVGRRVLREAEALSHQIGCGF